MKRSWLAFLAFFLAGASLLLADQTTSAVQQALKEQGFYYGDVTGKKTADTTAAIRRYQIRNGLQITGEIDAETLRSLGGRRRDRKRRWRPGKKTATASSHPNRQRFRRRNHTPLIHRNARQLARMARGPAPDNCGLW